MTSKVIALWAHPRAVSTAFSRMMIERGDVTVIHEPLVTLVDHGAVELPALGAEQGGGTVTLSDPADVLGHLAALGEQRPVFVKDTLEYRYPVLFDRTELITGFDNTFLVRDPAKAIPSHYALDAQVGCESIGYKHQHDLFTRVWETTGRRPLVMTAERLLAEPAAVVAAYCEAVGLDYLPDALTWQPDDRPEWSVSRRWHLDAINSTGFTETGKQYTVTVENDARLRSYYEYHLPFYAKLVEHAL